MQFLDYLVLEKLGEGGTGTVYRAQDRRQGRMVALKVTRQGVHAHREAHALRLRHPHVLTPERLETLEDGRLLLVMPLLEGRTLEKFLVPISLPKALAIVRQAATGLAYAHARGVLHCDLKPANLMLSGGHLHILDFGLSQLLESPEEGVRGTLEYLSPEAARGQKPTPQGDLWSLGVVFYELLTGRSPFAARSVAETLRNIAETEPGPVTSVRPGLPRDTDALLERLLSKDARTRYPSASALLTDLGALAAGAPLAPPGRAPKPAPKPPPEQVVRALPVRPALLVGRDDERALLSLYLQDPACRLLTLQGLGGVGKTHLGLWAAYDQTGFSHVHGAELAEVGPGGFRAALARALGAEGEGMGTLTATIGSRRQLLLLDNFEHLESQRPVLEALLAACPNLVLLLTSRTRLGLEAEWVVPLGGLSLPPAPPPPDEAPSYGALALFAHKAALPLDPARDLPSVYAICRLLQGHPLGLTLAAAWTDRLSAPELLAALADFAPLRQGRGRHGSLWAVFRSSERLLGDAERTLLARLGVFAGGFEAAAARAVVGADAAALGALSGRSLLEQTAAGRYQQHPALAQFCAERFAALPDARALSGRHSRYYRGELGRAYGWLQGTEQERALNLVERDYANLRTAVQGMRASLPLEVAEPLRTFLTHKGRFAEGWALFERAPGRYARACAAWFALLGGRLDEAETLSRRALGRADPRTRMLALNVAAGVRWRREDLGGAKKLSLVVLELAQSLGDERMEATYAGNLALLEEAQSNVTGAKAYYEQSLWIARSRQDWGQVALNLNNLAVLYLGQNTPSEAEPLVVEGLWLCEQHMLFRMKPLLQSSLGLCLFAQGKASSAIPMYDEAYQTFLARGDDAAAATTLTYIGQALAAQGQLLNAKNILFEALQQAQSIGFKEGMLSALVRYAELKKDEDAAEAVALAALVAQHPQTEPADRALAKTLVGESVTTNEDLEAVVRRLLEPTPEPLQG